MANDPTDCFLGVQGLTIQADRRILRHSVSFQIRPRQLLRVIGPNGAGKTTLLKTLVRGLDRRNGALTYSNNMALGQTVAYLPQGSNGTLLPWLNAEENVMIGLIRAQKTMLSPSFQALVETFLNSNSRRSDPLALLRDFRSGVEIKDMSGGERQKLAILRTFICQPLLLFLDEPFVELDQRAVCSIEVFLKVFMQDGAAVIVSHQDVDLDWTEVVDLR